ncbi:MAG: hypothetical protein M1817_003569 [Caeruleum heppii]|nr:MAG: hypothetical protein M1817_003569 [Caeruleum heppii]
MAQIKFLTCVLCLCLTARHVAADLFSRDDQCAEPGFTSCGIPDLPSNFCCPQGKECIALNSGTSVLCCPTGQDCEFIKPISCDITQQNATEHPKAELMSTRLDITLEECDGQCCPEGYKCQDAGCVRSESSTATTASTSSTTSTSSPTETSPTTSTTDSTSASSPTSTATSTTFNAPSLSNPEIQCDPFPAKAVVAGFFPGAVVGAILGIVGVMCCRGRKKISAPIYQPHEVCRTDFLRRSRSQPPMPRAARKSEAASMEFVISEAPGRGSQMTAFTDLMEGAGFKRGEPYLVASPGRHK